MFENGLAKLRSFLGLHWVFFLLHSRPLFLVVFMYLLGYSVCAVQAEEPLAAKGDM